MTDRNLNGLSRSVDEHFSWHGPTSIHWVAASAASKTKKMKGKMTTRQNAFETADVTASRSTFVRTTSTFVGCGQKIHFCDCPVRVRRAGTELQESWQGGGVEGFRVETDVWRRRTGPNWSMEGVSVMMDQPDLATLGLNDAEFAQYVSSSSTSALATAERWLLASRPRAMQMCPPPLRLTDSRTSTTPPSLSFN